MEQGLGVNLHGTEIRVGDDDFAAQMTRMREWLDSHHSEPAVFRYDHIASAVIIYVDFTEERDAAAFAREFGGKLR